MKHEIVIIGGGPAGLAAAISARENGVEDVLVLERERSWGASSTSASTTALGCTPSRRSSPARSTPSGISVKPRNLPSPAFWTPWCWRSRRSGW